MNDFLDSFLDDYFAECEEHLTVVRRGLLALEGSVGHDRPDPVVTEELFRSFHSLKGISGMVEHRESELLAHEMESYLRAIREGEVRLTTGGVDTLVEGARLLESAIAARRHGDPAPDVTAVLDALHRLMIDANATTGEQPAAISGTVESGDGANWECLFVPSAALIARGINVNVVRERLRQAGDVISGTPLVMENGAVAFRFVFAGALDQATLDGWRSDGMVCAPLEESAATTSGSICPASTS
jgi:two-component system chemotaxis sensor kinase CheA